jgi:DNA invertase Pin-like site-specific DNA recombinase
MIREAKQQAPARAGTLTPAVGYIRMSSGKQEASPEQQRAEIKKLAARHGCRILREYTDEGISGDNPRRPGFQAILHDAQEQRDFAVILCWDQDRFARFDSIEAGRWIAPLREAGVWLITVAQGAIDWNTFTGRMMYGIVQEGKHQYLVDLSRNALRGRLDAAHRGQQLVAPAFGYDRVFFDEHGQQTRRVPYGEKFNKPKGWSVKLEPSADTAAVEALQWAFQTFADTDTSLRRLVMDLNAAGRRSPRGKGWGAEGLRYILQNRVYLGCRPFGNRRAGKYHQVDDDGEIETAGAKGARRAPIMVENTHPALVPVETFKRIQDKLTARRGSKSKTRASDYVLTGSIRCGHCGRAMCGQSGGKKGERTGRRYYRCPGGQSGRCELYMVRKEVIETYVIDFLDRWLADPKAPEKMQEAIRRLAKSKRGFQTTTKATQAKIAALDRKIGKGSENLLLADAANVPELSDLLGQWRRERERLQADLEKAARSPAGATLEKTARRAVEEIDRLRENLLVGKPALVRNAVKTLVSEVMLWWGKDELGRRRVERGKITVKLQRGFAGSTSNTASECRRWGTAGP